METAYPWLTRPTGGYVFVVTYGRSGSTVLQNLLNSIDGYRIRGENENALFHLMRSWHAVLNSEPMRGLRQAGRATQHDDPWYGAERVDPGRLGRGLADLFVREVLQPEPGDRVSGFKEIRFHTHPALFPAYLDFIHAVFPATRFVFNTRNHDAVAKSGWWATMPPEDVKAQLTTAETLFTDYLAARPGRGIRLHYDDYVGRPEAFRPLFDFLGEPFEPDRVAEVIGQRLDHTGTKLS